MQFAYLVFAAIVFLFGWAVISAWNAGRRGHSEEIAHDCACRRRKRFAVAPGRRRGQAMEMMIMGESETRIECTLTHRSGAHMRVCTPRAFPPGAQVRIACCGDEFVGYVAEVQESGCGHTVSIDIYSSTDFGGNLLTRFLRTLYG